MRVAVIILPSPSVLLKGLLLPVLLRCSLFPSLFFPRQLLSLLLPCRVVSHHQLLGSHNHHSPGELVPNILARPGVSGFSASQEDAGRPWSFYAHLINQDTPLSRPRLLHWPGSSDQQPAASS
ncbi:hypothetical protein EV126DRAFT_86221 [Verticillium dahliae]|nr:hypothetical protein EV126DRAFT_86221 [Verticillium dahliae]